MFFGSFEAKSCASETAACNIDSSSIESFHGHLKAITFVSDSIRSWYSDIVKRDKCSWLDSPSHLIFFLSIGYSLGISWHYKSRNVLLWCLRHDDIKATEASAGDKHFRSIEDILFSFFFGEGFHGFRIWSAIWFCEAIAGEILHRDESWKVFSSLLFIAEFVDHPGAHVVDCQISSCWDASCCERLEDYWGLQSRKTCSIFCVYCWISHLGCFSEDFDWEILVFFPFNSKWTQFFLGEIQGLSSEIK